MSEPVGNTSPVVTPDRQELCEGLSTWVNPRNGFRVLDLSFKADPRKRSPEWEAQSRKGVPSAEWNREFGSTWIVYDGKPVYADFDPDIHVIRGPILAQPRSRLIAGWDAGPNDVHLAWALGLTTRDANSVTIIDYHYAEDGDGPDFVQVVGARLALEWRKLGGFVINIADQSVFTESAIVPGKAFADIMRMHGMAPIPGEISFAKRRAAVESLIVRGPRTPALQVHERCDLIIEGFSGGYTYGRSATPGGVAYKPTPVKNKFSHVMNAVEYICSRLELVAQPVPYEGQRLERVSSF